MKKHESSVRKLVAVFLPMCFLASTCWGISTPVSECASRFSWAEGCGVGTETCWAEYSCDRVEGAVVDVDQGLLAESCLSGAQITGNNCTGCPDCPPKTNLNVGASLDYSYTEGWNSSVGAEGGFLVAKVKAEVGHDLGRTMSGSVYCSQDIPPCYTGGVRFVSKAQEDITKEMTTTLTYTSTLAGPCPESGDIICGPEDTDETETVSYDEFVNAECQNLAQVACE